MSSGWSGRLDGRMAANVNIGGPNNDILDHLIIVGRPAIRFGGGTRFARSSLWLAPAARSGPITSRYGRSEPPVGSGPLVRLDAYLRVTTPQSIKASAVLARATELWSAGGAVWIATALPRSLARLLQRQRSARTRHPGVRRRPGRGARGRGRHYLTSARCSHAPYVVRSYRVPLLADRPSGRQDHSPMRVARCSRW